MIESIPKNILTLSTLFIVLTCFFSIGQNSLRRKADNNLSRYLALSISQILRKGEDVFWDDLLGLYQSKLLLRSGRSLTYAHVEKTISIALEFLIKNFPSESNKWQKRINNLRRSIPKDQSGELILFESSKFQIPSPLKAGYRESVFFIPIISSFAPQIIRSESFGIAMDILFPGLFIIIIVQVFLARLPVWAVLLVIATLGIATFILCARSFLQYIRTVHLIFRIPQDMKSLEENILAR